MQLHNRRDAIRVPLGAAIPPAAHVQVQCTCTVCVRVLSSRYPGSIDHYGPTERLLIAQFHTLHSLAANPLIGVQICTLESAPNDANVQAPPACKSPCKRLNSKVITLMLIKKTNAAGFHQKACLSCLQLLVYRSMKAKLNVQRGDLHGPLRFQYSL